MYTSDNEAASPEARMHQYSTESLQRGSLEENTENQTYETKSVDEFSQSTSPQGKSNHFNMQPSYQKDQTTQQANRHMDTTDLRPEYMQEPFESSFQQPIYRNNQNGKEKYVKAAERQSPYFTSFEQKDSKVPPNQSSSSFGADRDRTEKSNGLKYEADSLELLDSKETSGSQSRKDGTDTEIRNYIQQQEHFLKNLENDRKKLNDKLRASQQQEKKDTHNEEIDDLQKRAESLLSKFMQPLKSTKYPVSNGDSDSERNEFSPQKHERSQGLQSFKPQYLLDSQSNNDFRREERGSYTPDKSPTLDYSQKIASPSDLDYSASERDRVLLFFHIYVILLERKEALL